MKLSVLIIACIFWLIGCSAYHPIHKTEDSRLKKLSLFQSPETTLLNENEELIGSSALRATTAYLFEENINSRPLVSVKFKIDKPQNAMHDSIIIITLDGENIQLFALEGRYVIPENLWVPIVHSQNIQYLLNMNHDQLILKLNDKQKAQLTAFFNRVIQQRDHLFPAIPPGMKKW